MKVNHVLLASNDNPIYYQFWNPVSRIYAEKFGIKPTLIWMGQPSDIEKFGLSCEWGEIIIQLPHPDYSCGWQTAWSIFWFMSLYPQDIFCTMGIDQVPLSNMLLGEIPSQYSDETYLTLADDAYNPSHWEDEGGTSPTSFHIVKGSIASKVYGFEKSFHDEIEKISESGIKAYFDDGEAKWGLDESYSSHKMRKYRDNGGIITSKRMFKFICERRIECCRVNEASYEENRLKEGYYGDAHLCRPFSAHKDYLEKLLDGIRKYE